MTRAGTPFVLLLLATASLFGGARAADPTEATIAGLIGTEWHLHVMKAQGEAVALVAGTPVTLTFMKNGGVAGAASVNRYFGSVNLKGGKLSWTPFGATQMAGPEPLMKQEGAYLASLSLTTKLERREKVLVLSSADGKTVLEFATK